MGRDYIAMALGLFFSMVIGIGLMTLVFYSSAATREKALFALLIASRILSSVIAS
jgi:hypothetical protein